MVEYDFVECQNCGAGFRVTRGNMTLRTFTCQKCKRKIRYPDDLIGDAPSGSKVRILRKVS